MKFRFLILFSLFAAACSNNPGNTNARDSASSPDSATATGAANTANTTNTAVTGTGDSLPAPFATPSVQNYCKIIGWPNGKTPVAPAGFTVTNFAQLKAALSNASSTAKIIQISGMINGAVNASNVPLSTAPPCTAFDVAPYTESAYIASATPTT